MRINNLHVTGLVVGQTGETYRAELPRQEPVDRPATDQGGHVPSTELTQWMALIDQEPMIRSEAVARAAQHVGTGYYLTLQSAFQTAQAILESKE